MTDPQTVLDAVAAQTGAISEVSRFIHGHPELAHAEVESAAYLRAHTDQALFGPGGGDRHRGHGHRLPRDAGERRGPDRIDGLVSQL